MIGAALIEELSLTKLPYFTRLTEVFTACK